MAKKIVLAGIVTFNPDIHRLNENLSALLGQVSDVLIVDNGSNNISEIEVLEKIKLITFDDNKGIAAALSRIMEYARENEYEWVLALDQDSVIEKGLIDAYTKAIQTQDNVAMFSCLIRDRNFRDKKYEEQKEEVIDIPYCITSASLTNVQKYFSTHGYDEDFFIDNVDFDLCYTLREAGYRICRVKHKGLYHEVGHGENRKFLWKEIVVYHHNPFRVYHLARNTVRMYKKHKTYGVLRMIKKELALGARILLYEEDGRIEKWNAFLKGIKDANQYGGYNE